MLTRLFLTKFRPHTPQGYTSSFSAGRLAETKYLLLIISYCVAKFTKTGILRTFSVAILEITPSW